MALARSLATPDRPPRLALRDAAAAGDRAGRRCPAVLPLARCRHRVGPFRAHALRAAHDPAGVGDRDVVARRLAAPGDATADAPRADALPVHPVPRPHDPGIVPDVRPRAALPGVR